MVDMVQLYAACIVEYARRHTDGLLKGPFTVIGKDARDAFNLTYSESVFSGAIEALEKVGCLKTYRHTGMQVHYRVSSSKFDTALKIDDVGFRNYVGTPWDNTPRYEFLESYADLGFSFLEEALLRFDADIDALAGDQASVVDANEEPEQREVSDTPVVVDSAVWTGRELPFRLTAQNNAKFKILLEDADRKLDDLQCANSEKAMARAYIIAMKTLADAPDPPDDLIWEMLQRVSNIASVCSLFVSVVSLFVSVTQ